MENDTLHKPSQEEQEKVLDEWDELFDTIEQEYEIEQDKKKEEELLEIEQRRSLAEKYIERLGELFSEKKVFIYKKQDRDVLDSIITHPAFIEGLRQLVDEYDVDFKSYGQLIKAFNNIPMENKSKEILETRELLIEKRVYAPNPPLKPCPTWVLTIVFLLVFRMVYDSGISIFYCILPPVCTIAIWKAHRLLYHRCRLSVSWFLPIVLVTVPMYFVTSRVQTDGFMFYYTCLLDASIISGGIAFFSKTRHRRINIRMEGEQIRKPDQITSLRAAIKHAVLAKEYFFGAFLITIGYYFGVPFFYKESYNLLAVGAGFVCLMLFIITYTEALKTGTLRKSWSWLKKNKMRDLVDQFDLSEPLINDPMVKIFACDDGACFLTPLGFTYILPLHSIKAVKRAKKVDKQTHMPSYTFFLEDGKKWKITTLPDKVVMDFIRICLPEITVE